MEVQTLAVVRLEKAGRHSTSIDTLRKNARAVGCKLEIRLVPDGH